MTDKLSEIKVALGISKERIDKYLPLVFKEYSRTFFQDLIKTGKIKLNAVTLLSQKSLVSANDIIAIDWPEEKNFELPQAQDINLKILYEDDDILVIDKEDGIVVHPAAGNWSGTIVNALLGKDNNFLKNLTVDEDDDTSKSRPGIVHRLDKDTSGCLIVAKNIKSKIKLSDSFSSRKVKKTYLAITYGVPNLTEETIINHIGRHRSNRQKMAILKYGGKKAITTYKVIKSWNFQDKTLGLCEINIETGRTHQIRVHMASKNAPILGDKLYGGSQLIAVKRQMLHAWKIVFPHPNTGKIIEIESPMPDDFKSILY